MVPDLYLIEADPDVRRAMAEILGDEGYRVDCPVDTATALERLRGGERPRMILLDPRAPGLDAFSFYDAHQTDGSLAQIPVVFLPSDPMNAERARSVGAEVLCKPFSIAAMFEMLAKLAPAL